MSDDRDLSRRALLTSLGTVGGVGAAVGTGTGGLFTDVEELSGNTVSAGTLDLEVTWPGPNGRESSEDGTAEVDLDLSDHPHEDSKRLTVELPSSTPGNNPARVWLVPTCPTGEAGNVQATFSYPCESDGTIIEGTLADVVDGIRLLGGLRVEPDCGAISDDGCLRAGKKVQIDTEFEFIQPDNSNNYDGTKPVTFTLQFVGQQCRNGPFGSPFSVSPCRPLYGISYVEIYGYVNGSCTKLGKLELENRDCYAQPGIGDSYIEAGRTYDLYEDIGTPCIDTGYDVRVTDTLTKDNGAETTAIAFELLENDGSPGPDLCKVVVKGGGGPAKTVTYDDSVFFDGNATAGLLAAPAKDSGGGN